MACFFGHKWQGCTCAKCGKTRDMGHRWEKSGNCEEKCGICGQVREAHVYENGYCKLCGKRSDKPFTLSDLTPQELEAARRALTIARSANKDAKLIGLYTDAEKHVGDAQLSGDHFATIALALLTVSEALMKSASDFLKKNPQEGLARVALGSTMQLALKKVNDQMTAFNAETSRRTGQGTAPEAGKPEAGTTVPENDTPAPANGAPAGTAQENGNPFPEKTGKF